MSEPKHTVIPDPDLGNEKGPGILRSAATAIPLVSRLKDVNGPVHAVVSDLLKALNANYAREEVRIMIQPPIGGRADHLRADAILVRINARPRSTDDV